MKRAYRALAKRHHPDAGQGSVVRFLEGIQAAYEALVGGASADGAGGAASARPSRASRRPAQPGGSGGTPAGAGAPGPGARGPAPGAEWARRPRGGSARRPGAGSAGGTGSPDTGKVRRARNPRLGRRAKRPDDVPRGRRATGRRRATLGSTSYDGAEDAFEPDWGGAAWYGPSSGTYWTINPKEYADPRKHGPEYQPAHVAAGAGPPARARARGTRNRARGTARRRARAPGSRQRSTRPTSRVPPRKPVIPGAGAAGSRRRGGPTPGPRQRHRAPSELLSSTTPRPMEGRRADGRSRVGRLRGRAGPLAHGAGGSSSGAPPVACDDGAGGVGPGIAMRVVLAVAGWLVPGLAVASLAGLPGGLLATLPLQVAGVAVLALVPRVDGGRMFITKNKLNQIEALGEIHFKDTLQQTIFNVIASYYNIVGQKQQLASINEAINFNKEQVTILQASFNAGLGAKTSLLQAKIDLNVYQEAAINQQYQIVVAKRSLNQLLVRSPEIEFEVVDSIINDYVPNKDSLFQKLYTSNINILAAQRQLEIARLSMREFKATRMPRINLTSGYNLNFVDNTASNVLYNHSYGPAIGATLTVPIFQSGTINRQVSTSKIQMLTAGYNFDNIKLRVNTQLQNALTQFENQQQLLNIEKENEMLARENIEIAIQRLRLGQANSLEVRQAQESYVYSYTRRITFEYNLKIAETRLKQLVSGL